MLPGLLQRIIGTFTRTHQIAHRLMCFIWNPYWSQRVRAMQTHQAHRIAPIGLHPIAWTLGDERRRHHLAVMPEREELTIQIVSGRASLVAK
jgi:hypothetical protein